MNRLARGFIFAGVAALAASAYAASGDTPVAPANQPDKPSTPPPGGFPPVVVPIAIAVGAAVGLATGANDSVQISGTGTATGTASGTM